MDRDMVLAFIILAATIALFVSDWLRLDVVALLSLLALSLSGILTPAEALAGFSDPIVVMIAGLFVVGGGLFRTGVASRLGYLLAEVAGTSRLRLTAVLMLTAGVLSGFLSSTGTVAVMLPVTVMLARNASISPSKLLIPLAFASLLGGMLTLIGTPPNIVVSNQLQAEGLTPFGFFDFTPIGLLMLLVGVGFMLTFGWRLLPDRAPTGAADSEGEIPSVRSEELAEGYGLGTVSILRIRSGSPLVGQSLTETELRKRYGVTILRIRTPARVEIPRRREITDPLRHGDLLDVQGSPEAVTRLQAEQRLATLHDSPEQSPLRLTEVQLTPRSRLIGQSLSAARFRDVYGVHVLSIMRLGKVVEGGIPTFEMRLGDTLLVTGPTSRIDLLRRQVGDFVVVAEGLPDEAGQRLSSRAYSAIAVMAGMMVLLTFNIVAAATAVLLAAVLMVLVGALDVEAAYRSINWESVVLIAGILPMATALEKTGGMLLIVNQLGPLGRIGPLAMAGALFLITSALSQIISNTATTVLLAPIAFRTAIQMDVSPYPMLMIVAIAASTAFATPIASPVNTLVLVPGQYRFADFFRIGVALQLLILLLALAVVPLLFPF